MSTGIVAVDAAAEHRDRRSSLECATMRRASIPRARPETTTAPAAASPRARSCATELPYGEQARAPTIAIAGRPSSCGRSAAYEQTDGRIVDGAQPGGEGRDRHGRSRRDRGGEVAPIRGLVERAAERVEPARARGIDQVLAGSAAKTAVARLAHSVSSRGGR